VKTEGKDHKISGKTMKLFFLNKLKKLQVVITGKFIIFYNKNVLLFNYFKRSKNRIRNLN